MLLKMIVVAPISAKFAMAYLAFLSSALGFVFWSFALEHAGKGFRCNQLYVYSLPIVAAIVAAFLLGEASPNMGLYIGGAYYTWIFIPFNQYR